MKNHFKKIGTRILDMLKQVYKDKAITLTSRSGKRVISMSKMDFNV